MGWTIFYIVLAVLCLLLLLPVRLRFAVHGKKKWQIKVYYACFPVFSKNHDVPMPAAPASPVADDIVDEDDLLFMGSGDAPPITNDTPSAEKTAKQHTVPDEDADAALFSAEQENAEDAPKAFEEEKPKKRSLLDRVKPHGVVQWKELLDDALASLAPPLRFLLRYTYLRKLYVSVTVGTKDAAKTAILYGAVCGVIYRTLGKLQCHMTVKPKAIRVRVDFFNSFCTAQCSGELWISPMTALALGFGIAIPFLWRTLWRVRRQEKQKQQEDAESAPLPVA